MAKRPKEGEIFDIGEDWEILFPGEYLRGIDIEGKFPTVKIVKLYRKRIRGKVYPVAELEGKDRKWKINFTNGLCLMTMLGPNPKKWVNHEVTLCTEIVDCFGRGPKPCIRVYGSPELTKEMKVYKDLGDFGAISRIMKPTKRNGGPPTSRSAASAGGAP